MKKKINLSIQKINGQAKITIRIPMDLENFFRTENPQRSIKWKGENGEGIEFYAQKDEWKSFLQNIHLPSEGCYYDDFGSFIIKDDNDNNTAILRTKGASEKRGVEMICDIGAMDVIKLESYIRAIGKIAKEAYKHFLQKVNIRTTITFEI